jgi:hypothetical protein
MLSCFLIVIPDLPRVARGKIGNPELKKHLDSHFHGNDRKESMYKLFITYVIHLEA